MSLDQPAAFVKHHSPTRDAFLNGRLIVLQPRTGFRAGLDSVLLGAAVAPSSRTLLDLGAGVGTASLVAMAHNGDLNASLAEIDPQTAQLAKDNLAGNGLAGRARVIEADVVSKGSARHAAGLLTDHYDSVIANPPFFEAGAGTPSSQPARARARHMQPDAIERWVKTAAGAAAPGGEIVFIHVADALPALLAAFASRFGAITLLPLAPRATEAASRVLIRGIKGSRAPMQLRAPLVLHETEGRAFRPDVDAIFRGLARLDW